MVYKSEITRSNTITGRRSCSTNCTFWSNIVISWYTICTSCKSSIFYNTRNHFQQNKINLNMLTFLWFILCIDRKLS
jgi:hypothetical protein